MNCDFKIQENYQSVDYYSFVITINQFNHEKFKKHSI